MYFFEREGDGAGEQITLDDAVHDARSGGARGRNVLAEGAHLDGQLGAGQARQALRTGGAGDDTEQHFRLADLCRRNRDAVVASHGKFQTSAERGAVDRRDYRLGTVLDVAQAGVNGAGSLERCGAGGDGFEEADIGARDKGAAGADQDGRAGIGVLGGARDGGFDSFRDAGAESVYGRIIHRNDGDEIAQFVANKIGHGSRSSYNGGKSVRIVISGMLFVMVAAAQVAPNGTGDSCTTAAGAQLNGEEFHAIVGFEQSGASGSDSARKFFLDFFVSRPVPGLFRVTAQDDEPWFRWWGDVRISSAPRSIGSAISAASLTSNATSLKFNEVAQSAEFLTGLDARLGYICCALWGQTGLSRQRFLLSLTTAFGASGSLTAIPPASTAMVFDNPVNSPIYPDFIKAYPAAANAAYKYVSFVPPFPDRYFKEYFGGFRLTTRYADPSGNALRAPSAMVTATIGQNELITAGKLRGVVSRVEAFYPLATGKPGIWSAIYLFATAQLRWGGAHATVFPLTPAASPDPAPANTNTLYIIDRSSRDYYTIGAGVDLIQFLNSAKIVWQ